MQSFYIYSFVLFCLLGVAWRRRVPRRRCRYQMKHHAFTPLVPAHTAIHRVGVVTGISYLTTHTSELCGC